jgi:septal ring-binding cell division protein DamX
MSCNQRVKALLSLMLAGPVVSCRSTNESTLIHEAASSTLAPPVAPARPVVESYFGHTITDPYPCVIG